MKKTLKCYLRVCQKIGAAIQTPSSRQAQFVMFAFGVSILAFGLYKTAMANDTTPTFNDERISNAFDRVLTFLEGSFGALIMVAAGLDVQL